MHFDSLKIPKLKMLDLAYFTFRFITLYVTILDFTLTVTIKYFT